MDLKEQEEMYWEDMGVKAKGETLKSNCNLKRYDSSL